MNLFFENVILNFVYTSWSCSLHKKSLCEFDESFSISFVQVDISFLFRIQFFWDCKYYWKMVTTKSQYYFPIKGSHKGVATFLSVSPNEILVTENNMHVT